MKHCKKHGYYEMPIEYGNRCCPSCDTTGGEISFDKLIRLNTLTDHQIQSMIEDLLDVAIKRKNIDNLLKQISQYCDNV